MVAFGYNSFKKYRKYNKNLHQDFMIQELLMPTIQSAELWKNLKDIPDYGKEMLRIADRNKVELLYGPTNEELITDIVSKDLRL